MNAENAVFWWRGTAFTAFAFCDRPLDAVCLKVDRRLLDSVLSQALHADPLNVKVGVGE